MSAVLLPVIEKLAVGLVVAAADTGPVKKVTTAMEGDVETFVQDNPMLVPVLDAARQLIASLADQHGLGIVETVLTGIFPFLAVTAPAKTVVEEQA